MVSFNAMGAGAPTSFVLKNTTSGTGTTGSSGTTGTGSGAGTNGGYSTNSTNGTTGTTGTTGSAGAADGNTQTDSTTWSGTTSAKKSESSAEALQDRFLTLLVAQMRNQDPLNPLENAEVTTQMAQISTVEGVAKMNQTLSTVAAATGMNRASASTGLIGQDVFVPGNKLSWDSDSSAMRGGVTLDADATQVTVELFDASGKVVDQRTFSDVMAGTTSIDWNGRGTNGSYGPGEYTMRATVMSDTKATATTLTTERVTGVVDSAEGVVALLAGGKQIAISKINGVFQSRTGTTDKPQA